MNFSRASFISRISVLSSVFSLLGSGSEEELQRQLADSRVERATRIAEIRAERERVRCRVEGIQLAVEAGDVHPVEEIEELRDELQLVLLGEEYLLRGPEVEADEAVRVERIPTEAGRAVREAITIIVE